MDISRFLILLVLGLVLTQNLLAQEIVNPWLLNLKTETDKTNLILLGEVNSFPTSNLNEFFQPQLLQIANESYRTKISDKFNDRNIFASNLNSGILCSFNNSKKGESNSPFRWVVSLETHYQQEMAFNQYAGNLFLYGNKSYAGTQIDLAPMEYKNMMYQSLKVGSIYQKKDNSNITAFGINIGILNGVFYQDLGLEESSFFTSSFGDSIYMDFNFNIKSTEIGNHSFLGSNGIGSAMDFYYYKLSENNEFFVSLSNLGVISWNKETVDFGFDSSLSFTGFDIFSDNDYCIPVEIIIDTINNLNDPVYKGRQNIWLSPEINIAYSQMQIAENIDFSIGGSYQLSNYFFPSIYTYITTHQFDKFDLSGGLFLNKIGKAGLLLNCVYKPNDKFSLRLGSKQLEGLFLKTRGQSLYFSTMFQF